MIDPLWAALLPAAYLAADACLFTRFEMEHRRIALRLAGLPESLAGKRILQLSDLHVGEWTYKEVFIRHRIRECRADLVAITGDLISNTRGIQPALDLLEGISAPLGVWFVPGNNEIEEIELEPFIEKLGKLGIRTLVNEAAPLADGAWICGVNDPSLEKDDLTRALEKVPPKAFRLLLAHSPEIFYQASDSGVELTLSGHTHGGQVRLPYLGALWADTQRSGLEFVMGHYRRARSQLHVTRGVGTSMLPLRFLCPPELLEFELLEG